MNRVLPLLASLALVGCQVNDPGPSVSCVDCEPVVEPGASVTYSLEWFDEPCDSSSRTVPGLRFCTEVDVAIEVDCEECSVEYDSILTDRVSITPDRQGALAFTLRMTRTDTGEVHEEVHTLDAGLADRIELVCIGAFDEPGEPGRGDDCRVRSNGGGEIVEVLLRAYRGDLAVALDRERLTTSEALSFARSSAGEYRASMPAPTEPTTVTVTSASGATASLQIVP